MRARPAEMLLVRLFAASVLVLLAAPATAFTFPVYRDPLGTPGLCSGFDLAPGGPIVAVFDTAPDPAEASLVLGAPGGPASPELDPIRLATSCQIASCFEDVAWELASQPRTAPEAGCALQPEPGCEPIAILR